MTQELTPYLLEATWLTLKVALVSTLIITPPAIAVALLLARRDFFGKSLVQTVIALPLVLPPVAVGVMLLMLFGKSGPLGVLELVFTWWGAAIAAAVMSFPLLVRAAEAAFAEVPRRLEQVARTLGTSELSIFFRVTLPLARRGVLYGMVLAFSRGLGEFGATVLIAGNIPGETATLSLGIYSLYEAGHDDAALALIGVSLSLALISILTAERFLRRRP